MGNKKKLAKLDRVVSAPEQKRNGSVIGWAAIDRPEEKHTHTHTHTHIHTKAQMTQVERTISCLVETWHHHCGRHYLVHCSACFMPAMHVSVVERPSHYVTSGEFGWRFFNDLRKSESSERPQKPRRTLASRFSRSDRQLNESRSVESA